MKGKVKKMRIIDRRDIEHELYSAKYICNTLKKSGLHSGDTFDYTALDRMDPVVVASWADKGFIKLVSKQLVNSNDPWDVLSPEEFVKRLSKGKVKGSYHTRNLYQVITTDFDEFKETYINNMIWELNNIAKELKNM